MLLNKKDNIIIAYGNWAIGRLIPKRDFYQSKIVNKYMGGLTDGRGNFYPIEYSYILEVENQIFHIAESYLKPLLKC
jgi:hypothetical protein